MTSSTEELKTSDEWNREYDFVVHDPDGWDRKNYDESWYRPITLSEFRERAGQSTVWLSTDKARSLFNEVA